MNVHLFFCFNFSKKEASLLHIISLMMNNSEIVKLTWQSRISFVTYHKQKISNIICLILVFDCPMNGQKRRCVRISSTAVRWSNMTQGLPPKKTSFRFYAFFGIGCSLPSHLELKVLAFLTNRSFIVYPQQSNSLFKRSKNK